MGHAGINVGHMPNQSHIYLLNCVKPVQDNCLRSGSNIGHVWSKSMSQVQASEKTIELIIDVTY